jgi:hypothetical protein
MIKCLTGDMYHKIRMILGDTRTESEDNSPDEVGLLVRYLTKTPEPNDVLHPSRRDITNGNLPDLIHELPYTITKQVSPTNQIFYIFNERRQKAGSPSWTLAVSDPTTVLECARQLWGPEIIHIARRLIERGIPFRTLTTLPPDATFSPVNRSVSPSLGWRHKDYIPDRWEYSLYEHKLGLFFRSEHSRAALLSGGITWRLGIESLGIAPTLVGPSEDAATCGYRVNLPDHGIMCDDILSDEEENFVCGVHYIATGMNF